MFFVNEPKVKCIHLVDPSVKVIETLQNKIIDAYISKQDLINVHRKKGQEIILDSHSKIVFVAGMGGKEILEIMGNLLPQFTREDRLVISPHRYILELRSILKDGPWRLIEEKLVKEDGQFYQIFCLGLEGKAVSLYGDSIWTGPVGTEYRQNQLNVFSQHKDGTSKAYVSYLNGLNC